MAVWNHKGGNEMTVTTDQTKQRRPQRFRPYPAYRASNIEWLRKIPSHWDTRRLKTVASVHLSNVDKHSRNDHVPVKLCNYVDVYYNDCITERIEFMDSTASPDQVRRFGLESGDVLVTKDSESWDDIAVPAVVADDLAGVVCGYHLAHIKPGPALDGRFLARQFAAIGAQDQFHVAAKGITRFGLGGDAIRNGIFLFPPIEEQHSIVDFLDRETARIDVLVERKERLIKLLQEKRAALITRAVTRGIDPKVPMRDSGVDWLGRVPKHWDIKKWRYCCRIAEGQVPPDDEQFRGRVLIAPNHIESGTGRILHLESAEEQGAVSGKYRVQPGQIVYSKIRPALNKACIAAGDWLCSADMYAVSTTNTQLRTRFLLYFMLSEPFVRLMVDESMRVAMPKVNRDRLATCPVLIPPVAEQLAIVRLLEQETTKVDRLIAKIRDGSEWLNEFRTALVSAAVTGKIDVRNESS